MTTQVLFPIATDYAGSIVHAKDAISGSYYECLQCKSRMVVKQGGRNAWHFAHYAWQEGCTPDLLLHKQTQLAIKQQFTYAQGDGLMAISYPCPDCAEVKLEVNIYEQIRVPAPIRVELENRDIAPPSVLDMAVFIGEKLWFVIEIVNTHIPEPETRRRLEEIGRPVFLLKADYSDLLYRRKLIAGVPTYARRGVATFVIKAFEVINHPGLFTKSAPWFHCSVSPGYDGCKICGKCAKAGYSTCYEHRKWERRIGEVLEQHFNFPDEDGEFL